MASSSYADGVFTLLLPNPASGGCYTCRVPPDSPATACLGSDSPLRAAQSVSVDKVEARLTLLEAENKLLKEENANLTNFVTLSSADLESHISRVEQEMKGIKCVNRSELQCCEGVLGRRGGGTITVISNTVARKELALAGIKQ